MTSRRHYRRRDAKPRRTPTALEPAPAVPDWMDVYGERMFVVGFTPGGFPIGIREEVEPHWLGE